MSLLGPNLEAFLAVVKVRSVQSSAKILGITQTGVTQRIKALESQLSTTLFIRSRRGMTLTTEGEALLRYCHTVKDLEGETFAKIKGTGHEARVRVTLIGPTSIMRTRVVPQCLLVVENYSGIVVSFDISDEKSGAEALRVGAAQFAIIPPEEVSAEMDSKLLRPEQYVLVGTKKWRARDLKEIVSKERIIDFNSSDQMTHTYLKKFNLLSYARSERHFVNNNELLLEMLSRGLGYGVLTKEFAALYSKKAEIRILNEVKFLENRLALAWYPRPHKAPYFEAFIKAIH